MAGEISFGADFSVVRYAQCWEDADILLAALDIQPNHVCLSIASAGDNTLAMVSRAPRRIVALDLNPAQIACLELRVAAYRRLDYEQLLELIGARPSRSRAEYYRHCRPLLSAPVQIFWDAQPAAIDRGFGNIGRFERYLRLFGTWLLPLLQSEKVRRELLVPRTEQERLIFYDTIWDNWRWRLVFHLFFSRRVMGWLGRDPQFFQYVETDVASRLLDRARYAMTVLDPTENPYLQWILLGGRHGAVLPYALRRENFASIRANLESLEWHCMSIEQYLQDCAPSTFHSYNLSDMFEYISLNSYSALLGQLAHCGCSGGRLAYWNMLAPRRHPASLTAQLKSLSALSRQLYKQDKAFFYSDFVVEEII